MVGAAILSMLLAASEPGWNCAEPRFQQEMNWCAAQDFHKADAALNVQWKVTSAQMKRRDADQGKPDASDLVHLS